MTYLFKDHTADVQVEVESETLEGLFRDSGLALMETNVDLSTVEGKMCKIIELEESNTEKLLFSFLEELVFLKDSEYMVFNDFHLKIDGTRLRCEACGEKIDPERMKMGVDVKAVTYHKFSLEKRDKWHASFILDI